VNCAGSSTTRPSYKYRHCYAGQHAIKSNLYSISMSIDGFSRKVLTGSIHVIQYKHDRRESSAACIYKAINYLSWRLKKLICVKFILSRLSGINPIRLKELLPVPGTGEGMQGTRTCV